MISYFLASPKQQSGMVQLDIVSGAEFDLTMAVCGSNPWGFSADNSYLHQGLISYEL